MRTQPLNYCRDMANNFGRFLDMPGLPAIQRSLIEAAVIGANTSTKFMLPDYGDLIEDKDLKALGVDDLHIPYPMIALEFHQPHDAGLREMPGFEQASKRIIFAREHDGFILLIRCDWVDALKIWTASGPVCIPQTEWCNREIRNDRGLPGIKIGDLSGQTDFDSVAWLASFASDAWVLLSFLNALACSNVHVEKLQPPAPIPGRQPKKNAKSADVYHVLTLPIDPTGTDTDAGATGGSCSAKREHLRRGHIRRLSDGRKLWINAMVINAGKGYGRVDKDYQMRAGGSP